VKSEEKNKRNGLFDEREKKSKEKREQS